MTTSVLPAFRTGAAVTVWQVGALRDAGMLRSLAPVLLFEFGNLATTVLIVRATKLMTSPHRSATAANSIAVLIYAGRNALAAVASLAAGRWYDRVGPRLVFAAGAAARVVAEFLYTVATPMAAFGYAAAIASRMLLRPGDGSPAERAA